MTKLYGANGSEWKQVRHIPRAGEERGVLRYWINDVPHRNEYGKTWKMVKPGREDWASNGKWRR
ncbi:MAG: hypothetical protein ACYSUV_20575 [Planctomycetota bacterium]|jgi:hypothetical protein